MNEMDDARDTILEAWDTFLRAEVQWMRAGDVSMRMLCARRAAMCRMRYEQITYQGKDDLVFCLEKEND